MARRQVHFNLHNRLWSVTDRDSGSPTKGRVIENAVETALTDCVFHVGAAAQARIQAGAHRSVHAWIVGEGSDDVSLPPDARRIRYRPKECATFFFDDNGAAVWSADRVVFLADGACYAIGGSAEPRGR